MPAATDTLREADVAEEGQRDEVVAVLAHEAADALALAAEHEGHGTAVVHRVPALGARGVEAHHPDPARLQGLEGLHDVADAGQAHVLEGARRGAVHGLGEPGAVPIGKQHAVAARALGGAQDGAQVARVFDAVEDDEQGGIARRARAAPRGSSAGAARPRR